MAVELVSPSQEVVGPDTADNIIGITNVPKGAVSRPITWVIIEVLSGGPVKVDVGRAIDGNSISLALNKSCIVPVVFGVAELHIQCTAGTDKYRITL